MEKKDEINFLPLEEVVEMAMRMVRGKPPRKEEEGSQETYAMRE